METEDTTESHKMLAQKNGALVEALDGSASLESLSMQSLRSTDDEQASAEIKPDTPLIQSTSVQSQSPETSPLPSEVSGKSETCAKEKNVPTGALTASATKKRRAGRRVILLRAKRKKLPNTALSSDVNDVTKETSPVTIIKKEINEDDHSINVSFESENEQHPRPTLDANDDVSFQTQIVNDESTDSRINHSPSMSNVNQSECLETRPLGMVAGCERTESHFLMISEDSRRKRRKLMDLADCCPSYRPPKYRRTLFHGGEGHCRYQLRDRRHQSASGMGSSSQRIGAYYHTRRQSGRVASMRARLSSSPSKSGWSGNTTTINDIGSTISRNGSGSGSSLSSSSRSPGSSSSPRRNHGLRSTSGTDQMSIEEIRLCISYLKLCVFMDPSRKERIQLPKLREIFHFIDERESEVEDSMEFRKFLEREQVRQARMLLTLCSVLKAKNSNNVNQQRFVSIGHVIEWFQARLKQRQPD